MAPRYFTLKEARALLPQVRELVGKSRMILNRMQGFAPHVRQLVEDSQRNVGSALGTLYFDHLVLLQAYLSEIQETGCLVKSLEEGLVDFPHLLDGREVYLCWQYGEEDIEYWHEVDAGFAGRTPIKSPSD